MAPERRSDRGQGGARLGEVRAREKREWRPRVGGLRAPPNLIVVGAFAVIGDIEALALLILGEAQTDDHLDQQQDDQRPQS